MCITLPLPKLNFFFLQPVSFYVSMEQQKMKKKKNNSFVIPYIFNHKFETIIYKICIIIKNDVEHIPVL